MKITMLQGRWVPGGSARTWVGTEHFFIADGLFSHCQLWFAVAIGGQTSAFILNRWAANQNIDLLALAP